MSTTATVSDKGQVTLPKALRDRLGIHAGSRLAFRVAADGSLNVQVLAKGSDALFGLLAKPGEAARSLGDMDAAITEAVRERARRVR
jgi:AbrB family looped-hinge helix DNA binding protein